MKNKLDIPPELAHLIEKREGADRREPPAEGSAGKTPADSSAPAPSRPTKERRRGDRRKS